MTDRLRGTRALIYGGGTGIGRACAEAFVREGAAVFISSRREERLQEAAAKLSQIGKAGYAAGDATLPADVERRSEEHTSELQSLMLISYAVFCLKNKSMNICKHN